MCTGVGLETLLACPYRWNAATYKTFIGEIYNIIKAEMERLHKIETNGKNMKAAEQIKDNDKRANRIKELTIERDYLLNNYDQKIADFVQEIIGESSKVFGTDDWVDKLGLVWDLLKLGENKKDRYNLERVNDASVALKRKCVVHLLKLIRDKIEHIKTYDNEMKEKLPQFFLQDATTGQFHFNENNFIAFWIYKFPKLMPFLWIKFYKFKDNLTTYYSDESKEITSFQEFLLGSTKFKEELKCALLRDMENGNVVKRFQAPGCSLEVREFSNLTKVLDKNSFIKLVLNPKDGVALSVSHSSTSENTLEYAGTEAAAETVVLLFTDDIANEKMWKTCNVGCAGRIIVFSDPDKLNNERVEWAVEQFIGKKNIDRCALTECPVNCSELSVETQSWVLNEGQVSIQGRHTKIRDIFPESNINEVLGLLSGPFLNKLLKKEKPTLCSEYHYPQNKGVYIERMLTVSGESEFLGIEEGCTVVIIRTPFDPRYKRLMKGQRFFYFGHGMSMFGIELNPCAIFLKEPHKLSKGMIYECTDLLYWRDSNAYEFNDNNTKMTSPDCKLVRESTFCLSEKELVQEIIDQKVGTVCFQAESGMGKSKLLISLGKRLQNGLVIFYPFRTFVDLVKNRAKAENREDVLREDVKLVILEILKCKNDSVERDLIAKWLERKGNQGAKIEVQLDGLDEVPSKDSSLALKVCEIIEQNFDSIRLWITCHKSFPSTREPSEIAYCGLCLFSIEDQIKFFGLFWREKHKELTEEQVRKAVCKLIKYFKSFSDELMPGKFMGYPFNCSMLAEIFEDKLTELSSFKGSVIDFYDNIFHKRFAKMLKKEKINLKENSRKFKYLKRDYHQLHAYFALKHIFSEASNDFNEPKGIKIDDDEDDFTQMGFITGIYPISFSHLRYAHFFVAKYILEVLETDSLDKLCSKEAFDNLLYYGFPTPVNEIDELPFCCVLVDKYLEGVSDWNNLKWWKAKKTSLDSTKKREKMSLLLASAIQNKLWNLASLLIDLWVDVIDESVCNQVLELAKKYQPPMKWFIKMCKLLHYNNQDELPKCSDNFFFYNVTKYLIKRKCENEVLDKIAEMRKSEGGGGIFHCLVDTFVKECYFGNQERLLEDTKTFIQFVHKMNKEEINRKDSHGQNLLLSIPFMIRVYNINYKSKGMFKLKEYLIEELGADINEKTDKGVCVLTLGNYDSYRPAVVYDCSAGYNQMLKLLKQKGNFAHINLKCEPYGFTPLLESAYILRDQLSADTLQLFWEMGADFNATDNFGRTVLDICHQKCKYKKEVLAAKISECGGTFGDNVRQGNLVERE